MLKSLNLESMMLKLFALSVFLALPLSAQHLGDPEIIRVPVKTPFTWREDTVAAQDTICTTGIHVICHVKPKVDTVYVKPKIDTIFVSDALAIHTNTIVVHDGVVVHDGYDREDFDDYGSFIWYPYDFNHIMFRSNVRYHPPIYYRGGRRVVIPRSRPHR